MRWSGAEVKSSMKWKCCKKAYLKQLPIWLMTGSCNTWYSRAGRATAWNYQFHISRLALIFFFFFLVYTCCVSCAFEVLQAGCLSVGWRSVLECTTTEKFHSVPEHITTAVAGSDNPASDKTLSRRRFIVANYNTSAALMKSIMWICSLLTIKRWQLGRRRSHVECVLLLGIQHKRRKSVSFDGLVIIS